MDIHDDARSLLAAARRRGDEAVGAVVLPQGLDQFTAYVGLISSALELGKLIQTEERDLKVIDTHYKLEMTEINAAFRQVETKMLLEFQNDESLRAKTFEAIKLLIAAGQHEIAFKFYERMMDGFKSTPLETIIETRNAAGAAGTSRLRFK